MGSSIVDGMQEQSAIENLAKQKGYDLSQPGVEDAVRSLYRHQQGATTLDPNNLRDALAKAWGSTGASAQDVDTALGVYDRAHFTTERQASIEVRPVDDSLSANAAAEILARKEVAAASQQGELSNIGRVMGRGLAAAGPVVGLLDRTGHALNELGGFVSDHPAVGLALEGLEIVAGPAMYAVRTGVDKLTGLGEFFREKAAEFHDGVVDGLFNAGVDAQRSANASAGATFFAGMATGAVTSSVEGLRLVKNIDDFGSKLTGAMRERLLDISAGLAKLDLPDNVRMLDRGFSRLGTRGVAVLEHTAADGSTVRMAAVLANGDDVAKLGKIDWNEMGRIQGIADREAAATMRSWLPTDAQRANIQGYLDAGDEASAMMMYRMNMGTAQHGAVARALHGEGIIDTRTAAGTGVDFPVERIRSEGVPLPIELHPDSTYSFEKHIARDYPSYLTITTPKISMGRFYELFGKGNGG